MKTDSFTRLLVRYFSLYTAGFGFLLISLAILEHEGFPRYPELSPKTSVNIKPHLRQPSGKP